MAGLCCNPRNRILYYSLLWCSPRGENYLQQGNIYFQLEYTYKLFVSIYVCIKHTYFVLKLKVGSFSWTTFGTPCIQINPFLIERLIVKKHKRIYRVNWQLSIGLRK